jgi:hypothetical protein
LTRGIPRLINIFCDFLLLAAFTEETRKISVRLLNEVAEDLDSENRYWTDTVRRRSPAITAKNLQSIARRLDNLETVMKKQNGSRFDIEEIHSKLTYLENTLNSVIAARVSDHQRAAIRPDNMQLQVILRELGALKKLNAELAQKQADLIEANSKPKKSIWTLFSIR